jgi:hypothetical protein
MHYYYSFFFKTITFAWSIINLPPGVSLVLVIFFGARGGFVNREDEIFPFEDSVCVNDYLFG